MIARPQSHRFWLSVFAVCVMASIVGYMIYIARYGVNVVFWDEWGWTPLLHASHLTPQWFWRQDQSNRLFFPNILVLGLIRTTSWNDFAFFYVSAVFMCITLLLIVRVFWADIRRGPVWWLPIPFVVLTLAQYQNTLWAFQIAWALLLVTLVGALVLLLQLNPSIRRIALAIALGVVASYSSLQGLLVWPAGLIILGSQGQTRRPAMLWSAAGVVVTVFYFMGFNFAESGSVPLHQIVATLSTILPAILIALGSVIPTITAGISVTTPYLPSEVIGALLFVVSVVVVLTWLREGRPSGPKAFCVALIFVTIAFDLMLVPGRLVYGLTFGTPSRYATFNWPLLVGAYSYAILWARDVKHLNRPVWLGRASLTLLVIAQIGVGSYVGLEQGRITRELRRTTADILANYPAAPVSLAAPYILPPCVVSPSYCSLMNANVPIVEDSGDNVFSNPKGLANYRSLGIVPGGVAATSLPIPRVLRSKIESGAAELKAWNVLSAVYASDPAVQAAYPIAPGGVSPSLIAWAAVTAKSITLADIIQNEWAVPLGDAFFLQQYANYYQAWSITLAR